MRSKFTYILLSCVIYFSGSMVFAQDIPNVDVKSVPQSDIKRAESAIQDAGLTPQQAADLARQRGATEQQVQDMMNRMAEGDGTGVEGEVTTDPVQDAIEELEATDLEQTEEESTRKGAFDAAGRVFGSYLFNSKNLTFEPSIYIQTPKNYEIGIGDQILINIWGNSQNNYQLTVNRNGQITIPDVGPIYIAGMTFDAAEDKIKSRLNAIYADMRGANPETFAQINMGQLRSIQVNLVGDVSAPGTYTIPVTSTVFNALYLSGGPGGIGSFRNIKIIRDNKVFKTIDIYEFLIDADPSANIMLKDQDIIFIPPVEKRVEVTGEFKRTGLFEMKEPQNLDRLIRFAGGFTDDSYVLKLQIRRKGFYGYQIIDVPIQEASQTALKDGDEIRNYRILDIFENRVSISGAVTRPGEYEWKEDMNLKELIIKADSITPDAYLTMGTITRYNEDLTTTNITFNVDRILNGEDTIELLPEDVVNIKSHFALSEARFFIVSGQVISPGTFTYSDSITLKDAIFRANGFTEGADSTFIEVARRLSYEEAAELTDILVHKFRFTLDRDFQLSDEDAMFRIEPYDHISVKRAPGFRNQVIVNVSGEVKYAGTYSVLNKNQRISDLLEMAGGITQQAFLPGATLSRFSEELGSENVAIDLPEIINNKGSDIDLYLRNGDRLNIPEFMQTVKVVGNVENPYSLTFENRKNLKYYIAQAGGFMNNADERRVYVQYANGSTASTRNFIFKDYPKIQPGSVIVVPEEPPKEGGMSAGEIVSLSTALSSMALVIVTLVNTLSP
ncbi:SLBB domain-containing protein [Bacteroidota bacterium]